MNKRIQKYNEKYFSHTYKYERFDPPIKVMGAVISRWGPGDLFQNEKKKVLSLNLVTMGNGAWEQGNHSGPTQPGEVFLAHKGATQVFRTGTAGFLHKRSILIEGVVLDALLRTSNLISHNCIKPVDIVKLTSLFRKTFRLMRDKPDGFILAMSHCAYEILLELARSIAPEYPAPVQSAIEYMRRNLHRNLSLEKITFASGLSIRHFSRLFSSHLHMSPIAFFINQKMDLAQNMLLNTVMPVKQIAGTLGYEDQFHFSLQFKKHAGHSPMKFRDRYHE
jgi:AraC-like DNA-binding protein